MNLKLLAAVAVLIVVVGAISFVLGYLKAQRDEYRFERERLAFWERNRKL